MAVLKKNSTTKNNNSSPSSSLHPPYFQMISEAITTMKDRTGSSQPSIAKFMAENYSKQLPQNFKKILSIQLKRFLESGKLVKVKNSYKISASEKLKKSSNSVKKKMNTEKKKPANKATAKNTETKSAVAKESVEKAKKTKRLSQVKTPEKMKRGFGSGEKVKKNENVTPLKRKVGAKSAKNGSRPPAKKAKN